MTYDKCGDRATSSNHFRIMRALMHADASPSSRDQRKAAFVLTQHWDWFVTPSSVRADRPLPASAIPRMRYVQGLTKSEARNCYLRAIRIICYLSLSTSWNVECSKKKNVAKKVIVSKINIP